MLTCLDQVSCNSLHLLVVKVGPHQIDEPLGAGVGETVQLKKHAGYEGFWDINLHIFSTLRVPMLFLGQNCAMDECPSAVLRRRRIGSL